MKRIILHWTAGTHKASVTDRKHYHFIIDGAGNVIVGDNPVSANKAPIKGNYAAHTLNLNGDSIGVALAAMLNAKESPFHPGAYPITQAQMDAMASLVVKLCDQYGITIGKETVLTHAEVQPTLGVKQRGKWDITWLPTMTKAGNAVEVGEKLREIIRAKRRVTAEPAKFSILDWVVSLLKGKK